MVPFLLSCECLVFGHCLMKNKMFSAVIFGVIGGIVLLGILLLIAWKIITTIHDGREYAKFEKESKNAQFDRVSKHLLFYQLLL